MEGELRGRRQPTQWTATSASTAVVNEVRVRCVGHADADARADARAAQDDAVEDCHSYAYAQTADHGVSYSNRSETFPRLPPFARHGCYFVPHGDAGGTRAHRRLVPAFAVWGRRGGDAGGGDAGASAWLRICDSGPTAGDNLEASVLARSNNKPGRNPDPNPDPNNLHRDPNPNLHSNPNPNPNPNPEPGPRLRALQRAAPCARQCRARGSLLRAARGK